MPRAVSPDAADEPEKATESEAQVEPEEEIIATSAITAPVDDEISETSDTESQSQKTVYGSFATMVGGNISKVQPSKLIDLVYMTLSRNVD
jgi:hypothetical protein